MAATSKPVRKMRKEGKEPSDPYHSPKASSKKANKILKVHSQEVGKHVARRSEKESSKHESGKKVMDLATKLHSKLPKSTKKGFIGRHLKSQSKAYNY